VLLFGDLHLVRSGKCKGDMTNGYAEVSKPTHVVLTFWNIVTSAFRLWLFPIPKSMPT
jgi:hypothetical protein